MLSQPYYLLALRTSATLGRGDFRSVGKSQNARKYDILSGVKGGGDAGFDLILNLHNLFLPLHFIFRTYIVYIYIRKYIIYPSIIHDPWSTFTHAFLESHRPRPVSRLSLLLLGKQSKVVVAESCLHPAIRHYFPRQRRLPQYILSDGTVHPSIIHPSIHPSLTPFPTLSCLSYPNPIHPRSPISHPWSTILYSLFYPILYPPSSILFHPQNANANESRKGRIGGCFETPPIYINNTNN